MRNPVALLASRIGIRRAGRMARGFILVTLLVSGGLGALFLSPGQWSRGLVDRVGYVDGARDADLDGMPDALENLMGSDIEDSTTLGDVPDGWVHRWFPNVDWSDPSILDMPALVPPAGLLPEALRGAGALPLPTLAGLYQAEDHLRGGKYAWWLAGPALDPRQWDNDGDGIADAWGLAHGLDPLAIEPGDPSPGDPAMTLREKYDLGLDPTRSDSDKDGLLDLEELRGVARLGATEVGFNATDPRRFSSRDDGVADGYLVRFGLDPHGDGVTALKPAGDGVSVLEAFQATLAFCNRGAAPCDLRTALQTDQAVDPTRVDTLGDGVTDAWALRDSTGTAHPLVDARQQMAFTTKEWDASPVKTQPANAWANGTLVDGANPAPAEPFAVSMRDLYAYKRPASWNETALGTWWHGLPTRWEGVAGSLPPAVALRGWNVTVDIELGRNGTQAASKEGSVALAASADSRKADSDGDGLSDREEYFGVTLGGIAFPRTDPGNPDTDGDGLPDGREVGPGSLGTDPTRRDTAGSFLTDGQKVDYWTDRASNAPSGQDTALSPTGDLDGDGKTNVLDDDSDGDGLRDGAELFPDRFLGKPASNARPPTDPAKRDTDGDGLPDWWEVDWSDDDVFGCKDCILPDGANAAQIGWPLDPSKILSLPGVRGVPGAASACLQLPTDQWCDADMNLAGDFVRLPSGARLPFSNAFAYWYDLNPYEADADGDGLPNMFSIHWGVKNVPDFAANAVPPDHWSVAERGRLHALLAGRGGPADGIAPIVAINPNPQGQDPIRATSNLLQEFAHQEKGSWRFDAGPACGVGSLPTLPSLSAAPLRSETDRLRNPDAPDSPGNRLADRTSQLDQTLKQGCWTWTPYPLSQDVLRGTNPWRHDSDGDGLPDAWEAAYGVNAGIGGTESTPGSIGAGCKNTLLQVIDQPVDGSADFCLSYIQTYERGLDPRASDTDGGGLPDWVEVKLVGLDPLDPFDDRGQEDWDGDGLINLVEDKIGTSRLDPDSDGDGLLDGDVHGLRYAVDKNLPDKDLTFLLGTNGAGNLCLPGGPGAVGWTDPVRNATGQESTKHRPAALGGPMTYGQLFQDYMERGILHQRASGGVCPEGQVLFKREGIYDRVQDLVLGAGLSSSMAWDTSGDGVPDGWAVFWRDRTTDDRFQDALAPHHHLGPASPEELRDPDGDFLSTVEEYGVVAPQELEPKPSGAPIRSTFDWRRPDAAHAQAAWDEGRDGTWWAGPDPTSQDTDGDKDWYASLEETDDRIDPDLDNDGIPDRDDPFPALDPANVGIIRWDPSWVGPEGKGRYKTNLTALWGALEDRSKTSYLDPDFDGVPTFLDRFHVRVDITDLSAGGFEKGGKGFTVTGSVTVDEPEPAGSTNATANGLGKPLAGPLAANGAKVQGLTVKAVLRDSTGREAVAGFNFTDSQGSFTIKGAALAEALAGTAPAGGATVSGRIMEGGNTARLPTPDALLLVPGPLQLFIVAEANDPGLQPLSFHPAASGEPLASVAAFKQAAPTFTIPDGRPPMQGVEPAKVRAVLVDPGFNRPLADARMFRHATAAAFPAVGDDSRALELSATTTLLFEKPEPVFQGDNLTLAGRLLDATQGPLANRNIHLELRPQGGAVIELPDAKTAADGSFKATTSTTLVPTGSVDVTVWAILDEPFLTDPAPVTQQATVALDMRWQSIGVNERDVVNGGLAPSNGAPPLRSDQPLQFEALLVDHHNPPIPLANRAVTVTVQTVSGQAVQSPSQRHTGDDGVLRVTLPPLPAGTPLELLHLRVVPQPVTPADNLREVSVYLEPQYAGRIRVLANATTPVDIADQVRIALERMDGTRVTDPAEAFTVTSGQGEERIIQGVDAEGVARFSVNASAPGRFDWTIAFRSPSSGPLSMLHVPETAQASSLHIGAPVLHLEALSALRGQATQVAGALALPDGAPIGEAAVNVTWGSSNATLRTDAQGLFKGTLTAPATEGASTVVARFMGSEILKPAQSQREVLVRVPTVLAASGHNVTFNFDRTVSGPLVTGRLTDDLGAPLPDRRVLVLLEPVAGNGSSSRRIAAEVATDRDGRFELNSAQAFPALPGAWGAEVRFNTSALQQGTAVHVHIGVIHTVFVELLRVPAAIDAGKPYSVAGRLKSSSDAVGPVLLNATLNGVPMGAAAVLRDEWSIPFTAPMGPNGTHILRVAGSTTTTGVVMQAAEASVLLTSPVTASVFETPRSDGTRGLSVHVKASEGIRLEGLEVMLVREADGEQESLVATLDGAGQAQLELAAWQTGDVRIVALRDPKIQLESVAYATTDLVQLEVRTTVSPWVYGVSAGVLMALGLLVAYLVWQRRQLQTLRNAVRQSHELLLDPHGSPARAVRELYASLLRCLRTAGYPAQDEETVRDIALRARREFGLPTHPMDGITRLFEQACYSDRELSLQQRNNAVDVTRTLASHLGVPLRVIVPAP